MKNYLLIFTLDFNGNLDFNFSIIANVAGQIAVLAIVKSVI
jgi:hypothetical protein